MASKEWVKFNEDSRAGANRALHVDRHGGEFVYRGTGRGWHWVNGNSAPVAEETTVAATTTSKKKTTTKKKTK